MPIRYVVGVVVPLLMAVAILVADFVESEKTAYVGVLTAIPLLAAIFVPALATFLVGVATWLLAFGFGEFVASDGMAQAQAVRLGFIAASVLIATVAAAYRARLETSALRAESAQAIAELAYHDAQTDLANRRGADRWVSQAASADRWVLMCDADGLKAVNDTFGHEMGDKYIAAIAKRLRANVAEDDFVARWGGDEFLVIVDSPSEFVDRIAGRVGDAVKREPVTIGDAQIAPSLSIGIAPWSAGSDFDAALRQADAALYLAKNEGTGLVRKAMPTL